MTGLDEALRLIVLTDAGQAAPRSVPEVVGLALDGGCRAIQLRAKELPARDRVELGRELRRLTRARDALLFVNDRADLARIVGADGVHLGPDDPPVAEIRAAFGPDLLIGFSTDDPEVARRAADDGADYLGCGAVYGTGSKDVGGEAIGLDRLRKVVDAVDVPVVGIGGITPARAGEVERTGAAGCAVIGSVMGADEPDAAVRELLRPWISRG